MSELKEDINPNNEIKMDIQVVIDTNGDNQNEKTNLLNSSGSSSDSDCPICLDKIEKNKYGIVNGINEWKKKFHPKCLTEWFKRTSKSITSDNKVESFNIHEDNKVTTIFVENINGNIDLRTHIEQINAIRNDMYKDLRLCKIMSSMIIIILVVLMISWVFFIN